MTVEKLRSYHFSTDAQWRACLFEGADRDPRRAGGAVRPYPPYGRPGEILATDGAHAPATARDGEILWRDDAGRLHRLPVGEDLIASGPAPVAIARAERMVVTANSLWVASGPASLQRREQDTLAQLVEVTLPDGRIADIASGGYGAVLALVERGVKGDGAWQVMRVDGAGRVAQPLRLEGLVGATALVFLRSSRRIVVLTAEHRPRLCWFPAGGGRAAFTLAVGGMRPCFSPAALGSNGRDLVFLAGAEDDGRGGAWVLALDGDGNRLGDVPVDPLDAPVRGVTATREALLVAGPRGLVRFTAAQTVPDDVPDVRCTVVTPVLQGPDREDNHRWLRIEGTATLPAGSTLELSFGATDDPETRDRLNTIVSDPSLPASHRLRKLLGEPEVWSAKTVFHGSGAKPTEPAAPFSTPLFDVRERWLWACATLIAGPGAALPVLIELDILYPGRSLMEDLPAIYRRDAEQPGSFLRGLVGVLEATTQGLDAEIGSLGSRVHPSTAEGPWLDFVARWLGLPWDDALGPDQKKALLGRARELAASRGTRAGLEKLFEAISPDGARRFRLTDATADFGFAVVGDGECAGSALPAMLGGYTRWTPELDTSAVLGTMRLPCPGQRDDGVGSHAGRVRVEVAATAEERSSWEPWLLALVREMVPLTARPELRWVSPQALRGDRLDGNLTLEPDPEPHLGTDAVTGLARLPATRPRLTAWGSDVGSRLR
jgi:phage tail-like protein